MSMLHPPGGCKEPVQAAAQGALPVAGEAFPVAHCAVVVRVHGALVAALRHVSRHKAPLFGSIQQRRPAATPSAGAGAFPMTPEHAL